MSIEDLDTKAELGRWIAEYLEGEPLPQSAVEGLQSQITASKWNPLVLENGWSSYGGGFAPAAYRVAPGGAVQLRGMIQHPTVVTLFSGLPFATLPKGLGPKEGPGPFSALCALEGLEGMCRVDVSAGEAKLYYQSPEATVTWLSLSQISWTPGN